MIQVTTFSPITCIACREFVPMESIDPIIYDDDIVNKIMPIHANSNIHCDNNRFSVTNYVPEHLGKGCSRLW